MEYLILIAGIIVLTIWRIKSYTETKARFGENNVSKQLSKLPENCIVLNDIYIPKKNGTTIRIDHIVINHNGLFVIETKNYNGFIKGSENNEYWTQVISGQNEYFYNPILQNAGRIKALKEYLRDTLKGVPVHSVIVFGNHAALKLDKPVTQAKVIKRMKLSWLIQHDSKNTFVHYFNRNEIKQLLSSTYIETNKKRKRIRKKYITDITQYKSDKHKKSSMRS